MATRGERDRFHQAQKFICTHARFTAHRLSKIYTLVHPNIVRVFDFGVEAGTPFLVMEYAPNGSLRRRHPRGETVPLPTLVSYVKQVAAALHYAHQRHFVHRDVKPENMLLRGNDEILLSDFGLVLARCPIWGHHIIDTTGESSYEIDG